MSLKKEKMIELTWLCKDKDCGLCNKEKGYYTYNLRIPYSIILQKILPELREEWKNWLKTEKIVGVSFVGKGEMKVYSFLDYLQQNYVPKPK